MKKNGFTLVELMAVIIILSIILILTIPTIDKSIKNAKEVSYNEEIEIIKKAAMDWTLKNPDELPLIEGNSIVIYFGNLKKDGLLPIDMKNPKNGKIFSNSSAITITKRNGNFDIDVNIVDLDAQEETNAPILILNGSAIDYVEVNQDGIEYTMPTYTAKKYTGETLSSSSVNYQIIQGSKVVSKVDTSKLGTYTIKYSVTADGKTGTYTKTVVVKDTTAPNLEVGPNIFISKISKLNVNSEVVITDNSGETITPKINCQVSDLDGDYYIYYTATDSSGNSITKRRMVSVIKSKFAILKEIYNSSALFNNDKIKTARVRYITQSYSAPLTYTEKWEVSDQFIEDNNSIVAYAVKDESVTAEVVYDVTLVTDNDIKIYSPADASYLFSGVGSDLNTISEYTLDLSWLNTKYSTEMEHMFQDTGSKTMSKLNLGANFDTSNVTDMSYMFKNMGYKSLTSLDLGYKFDTSNVTDMSYMFSCVGYSSTSLTSIDLGYKFDTSNVTNMSWMFTCVGYTSLTSLDLGYKFDTSNVTDMSYMFKYTGHTSLTSLDLGDIFDTSNVTNMSWMFYGMGYNSLISLDLGDKFDTSNVTNMSYMFAYLGYTSLTSLDFGDKFDTSNVTDMSNMFYGMGYNSLISLDFGDKFDTSNVTNMSYMFYFAGYTSLTSLDFGDKFDTSNVTDMSYMFAYLGYTSLTSLDLGDKFDTSNVIKMNYMFYGLGHRSLTSLDLGPELKNIASTNSDMFRDVGGGALKILVSSDIYSNTTNFKLNSASAITIPVTRATLISTY